MIRLSPLLALAALPAFGSGLPAVREIRTLRMAEAGRTVEREAALAGAASLPVSGPPAAAAALRRLLSVLPPDVFRPLEKAGTRVVILPDGASVLDAGVIQDVELSWYRGEGLAAARKLAEAIPAAEAEFPRLAGRRVYTDELDRAVRGGGAGIGAMELAMKALHELQEMSRAKLERTDELALTLTRERLFAARADEPGYFYGRLPDGATESHMDAFIKPPRDLAQVAGWRGARTGEQIREYAALAAALNPEAFLGDAPASVPFASLGSRLLILPDFFYHPHPKSGALRRLSAQDHYDAGAWDGADPRKRPEGLFSRPYQTMFMKEESVELELDAGKASIHEIGHALERAVESLSPEAYKSYAADGAAAYERRETAGTWISGYSSYNENEFRAESFSAYFSPHREKLRKLDPEWFARLERFLADAAAL